MWIPASVVLFRMFVWWGSLLYIHEHWRMLIVLKAQEIRTMLEAEE